ncbi:putative HTH-type transcriptional regulator YqaF [Amedibacterium intestinale]|uniref:helix-turn-helix transcriptional regulator n=1 Tax=Amedibacterium intestinale TaxID=2583452 RepID=UPI001374213D|nr:helix-turn-helix transcriptional regulator [Amedibacterium intestinale]BBK61882.1 putative HTH-type transcriptional regulator YqaF [Amedibacterium intestinale]
MIDLKELRTSKGFSQQELATKCDVIRQTISNIECGLSKPSIELAKKLGEVLEVDWTLFFEE